jgi:AraC-like DNA-binding protein
MPQLIENIFLFAAVQGFLLSLLLFLKKQNIYANRILAAAVLCISIDLVSNYLTAVKFYEKYPSTFGATVAFPFLYGPLFYFYALILIKRKERFELKFLLHFLPAIVLHLYLIPFYFLNSQEKMIQINIFLHAGEPVTYIFGLLSPVSGFIYTVLTFKVINKFNDNLKTHYSNIDKIKVNWLRYIIICGLFVWIVVALSPFIRVLLGHAAEGFRPIYLAVSIMVYAIGYGALIQPEVFTNEPIINEIEIINKSKNKYEKSNLTNNDIERIKQSLINIMQERKLYLNSELNLSQISDELEITNHNLSEVLNKAFGKNFYDFINSYRVDEVKERLKNPGFSNYSLLAIAFESGFSSKSSFNSIFKKYTNTTPSEYRKQLS